MHYCIYTINFPTVVLQISESASQPREDLVMKPVPLMHARALRPVVVEDVAVLISNLPESVQWSLFLRGNSNRCTQCHISRIRSPPRQTIAMM